MRRVALGLALLFVFVIPFKNVVTIEGVGTLSRVVGLLTAGFWLITVTLQGRIRRPNSYCLLVILFVVWNALTFFWTIDPFYYRAKITTYAQVLVLVLMLWDLFRTREAIDQALQAYVLGAYVTMAALFVNFVQGVSVSRLYDRYSVSGFDPNYIGVIISLAIPIAWYLLLEAGDYRRKRSLRLVNMALIPLAVVAVALTASRTAAVTGLVANAFGFWLLYRRGISGRAIALAAVVGVAILALPLIVSETTIQRIASTPDEVLGGTLHGRLPIWKAGLEAFQQRPIAGFGTNTYIVATRLPGQLAHNAMLSVLVELGLVGLLLYGGIWLFAGLAPLHHGKVEAMFWLACLLVLGLGASSLSIENREHTWLFLTLPVLAGAASARKQSVTGRAGRQARSHPHAA